MSIDADPPAIALYFYSLAKRGGAEKMLTWLACSLDQRGYKTVIFTLDPPGTESPYALPSTATWHQLGHRPGVGGKLQRVRDMRRRLRTTHVSGLIGFVMAADKTVYAAAHSAGVPIIAAERNDPVIYRERLDAVRRCVCWALMATCRGITVQLPSYVDGYPWLLRARIAVIPNPVMPKPAHTGSGDAPDGGIVVGIGRLHPQKGFDLLLAAFAKLDPSLAGWRLRIVGDGPQRAMLERQAAELGVQARVTFVGELADPGTELHAADLFAFPSRYEGFPNALAEAMSRGLPCIAYAGCLGAADLLEQGAAGHLVAPFGDTDALARGLAAMMADPHRSRRLGDAARVASRRYAESQTIDQWEDVIKTVHPYE
jgi:glycosyltransferase involved in cell wall biosynthesis